MAKRGFQENSHIFKTIYCLSCLSVKRKRERREFRSLIISNSPTATTASSKRSSDADVQSFNNYVNTHTHTYAESDGERCEVGGKQAEGLIEVVDEAVFHATVWCVLHKCTAVCGIEFHHTVALNTDKRKHVRQHVAANIGTTDRLQSSSIIVSQCGIKMLW